MGKIALVFSGQGAQTPGMGLDLYNTVPAAKAVFDQLSAIRSDIKELCFNSTKEELTVTSNTQPALFAVESAAAAALSEAGIKVDAAAGFSLGEITALAYSRVLPLEEAFSLVCERGRLMQEASSKVDSAMTAVLKLPKEQVEELAAGFENVYPVNYNCPGQVVVSGLASALAPFEEAVKAAGGRAMRLEPEIPLYSNVTGEVYPEDILPVLSRQISSPVQWEKTIRGMLDSGIDTFIESGPGATLSGLIRKTDSGAKLYSIATAESLEETVRALSQEN